MILDSLAALFFAAPFSFGLALIVGVLFFLGKHND
jgi:hypothetical protein